MRSLVVAIVLVLAARVAHADRIRLARGRLAPGVHRAAFGDVVRTFGTNAPRRAMLADLGAFLVAARGAGVKRVYLGGSLVGAKRNPGDVDLLFDEKAAIDAPRLIGAARASFARGIHVYPAGRVVEDVASLRLTGAQRASWSARPPTFLQLFQQDKRGRPVGVLELHLNRDLERLSP